MTAVLFVVTVLLHELGHAIVGRREGLTVGGITLSFIGGVTRLEGEARTPGAEVRIAGVGPLVSLLTGGVVCPGPLRHGPRPCQPAVADRLRLAGLDQHRPGRLQPAPGRSARRREDPARRRVAGDAQHPHGDPGGEPSPGWCSASSSWSSACIETGRQGAFDGLLIMATGWFLIVAARSEAAQGQVQNALAGSQGGRRDAPGRPRPGMADRRGLPRPLPGRRTRAPSSCSSAGRIQPPATPGSPPPSGCGAVPVAERHAYRALDVAAPMSDVVYGKPDDDVARPAGQDGGSPPGAGHRRASTPLAAFCPRTWSASCARGPGQPPSRPGAGTLSELVP